MYYVGICNLNLQNIRYLYYVIVRVFDVQRYLPTYLFVIWFWIFLNIFFKLFKSMLWLTWFSFLVWNWFFCLLRVFISSVLQICLQLLWRILVVRLFLIARLARSDPRNHFSVGKSFVFIYSILVYFVMFSFQVLTCLRIVSIRIILNLNKFRQVWTCSDMFENHMNHNNSYHIESEQV